MKRFSSKCISFLKSKKICIALLLLLFAETFICAGKQGEDMGILTSGKTNKVTEEKMIVEQTEIPENELNNFRLSEFTNPFGEQSGEQILTVRSNIAFGIYEDAEEPVYEEISTKALAQNILGTMDQEADSLKLMSISETESDFSFENKIRVYAGDTALLITKEEKEILLRIVEAEATCEDVKGRMLVANVVLNRVLSRYFPNSIEEVVFQHSGSSYQFSPLSDGRYWTVKISDKTREAVELALNGEDASEGALYFVARSMANKNAVKWFDSSLKRLFKYGVHEFFTEKER